MSKVSCAQRMALSSGLFVNPSDILAEEIRIQDIVQGLSNCCRFAGQCSHFYSVAEHSVHVANEVWKATQNKQLARIALLHDAPEAYLGDLVRAVKGFLPDYQDMEYGVWCSVIQRFNLEPLVKRIAFGDANIPAEVKEADFRMLVTERLALFPDRTTVWDMQEKYRPYGLDLVPLDPSLSRSFFMAAYQKYFNES